MATKTQKKEPQNWILDHAIAGLLVLTFAVMAGVALTYPQESRLFPLIIGALGLMMSIWILVQSVILHASTRRGGGHPTSQSSPSDGKGASNLKWWISMFSAPVYGFLFWLAGFYIASAAALMYMPYGLGYRRIPNLIILTVVTIAIMVILFDYVMGMHMPRGLLGDWFVETFIYSS